MKASTVQAYNSVCDKLKTKAQYYSAPQLRAYRKLKAKLKKEIDQHIDRINEQHPDQLTLKF